MNEYLLNPQALTHLAKRYSGKLLLRQEIELDPPLFEQLLQNNHFQCIPSIIHAKYSVTCNRCGNEEPHLFSQFPCIICKTEHDYCRNCIEMGRVSECEPLYMWTGPYYSYPKHEQPCTWIGTLTTYQQLASSAIKSAIIQGRKEHLIWAVCGSGKTEMLFPSLTKALQLGKRICIATPRADVVRELLPRLEQAFDTIHIQGLYGGSRDRDATAQFIVSTTHQLLRFKSAFDVLIIDEVDAFPYHADPSLPFATNRAKKSSSTTIYLTATPRINQKRKIIQEKLPHTFVPIRYHAQPLPVPKFKLIFTLQNQLNHEGSPNFILKWFQTRRITNRQTLIFVPTIELATKLEQMLKHPLMEAGIITSNRKITSVHSEDSNREEKIEQFREGEISIVITTTILERGVTFPSVDVLVINASHSVFDEAALVQIAGRAGRSAKDPTGEVVFFHDGKTRAMIHAKKSIVQMNKRAGF